MPTISKKANSSSGKPLGRILKAAFAVFLFSCTTAVTAQDLHFSQSYNTGLFLNPGLTGVFQGDIRFAGAVRRQWKAADAPYSTLYLAADRKFLGKDPEKGFFSAGVNVLYDRAADVNLTNAAINLNGSYSKTINAQNVVSFGVMAGLGSRQFDLEDIRFDNQFDGEQFNPNLGTGENFSDQSIITPDLGVGLNWFATRTGTRTAINLGAAAFHLHRPNQSFDGVDAPLEPRFSAYLHPTIQLNSTLDVVFHMMGQLQDDYFQSVMGGAARLHLNRTRGKELAVQAGFGVRFNDFGDALVPAVEVHYQYWRVGFTYDVNVSEFRTASNRAGGPELTVQYFIHEVRPPGVFKQCPLL